MKLKECKFLINEYGCDLRWAGKRCPQSKRGRKKGRGKGKKGGGGVKFYDGGCQPVQYCSYRCKKNCLRNSPICNWYSKKNPNPSNGLTGCYFTAPTTVSIVFLFNVIYTYY